jgi:vitamin B12 transporter
MKKLWSTILFLPVAASIFAQQDTLVHTTTEVEIQAERNPKHTSLVVRPVIFDSKKLPNNLDLGAWLERMSLAQINRNGAPGSAATIRFRGLSSDHTQILWNGIPINSVALGTCDLSLMPAFLFDGMYVSEGAGVNSNLIPGLGATLNLRNFESDSTFSCSVLGGYNSLLNQHLAADLHLGKTLRKSGLRITSRTKFFDQLYQNKFTYRDVFQIDKPVIEQIHNNGRNSGVTQDLSLKWNQRELKGSFWHQQRSIELPVSMGFIQNSQVYQDDAFSRACLTYQQNSMRQKWQLGYAYNHEKLHWTDQENPKLDSRYTIRTHTASLFLNQKIGKSLNAQMVGAAFHNAVANSGYGSAPVILTSGQAGITLVHHKGIHHTEMAGRMDFRNQQNSPTYSLLYSIKPALKDAASELEFQVSASRKFRLPDFNELYWNPGGNIHLKPEVGYCALFSTNYSRKISERLSFNSSAQLYYNNVFDWIQWQPATSQYWSPVNIQHVRTRGIEVKIGFNQKKSWGEIQLTSMAEVNKAEGQNSAAENDSWFVMIYSPKLRSCNSVSIRYRKLTGTLNHQISGKRFTDDENTAIRALPSYQLFHVFLSHEIKIKSTISNLACGIDNLLDVRYQSVRGYALPGRIFTIQFKITI